jgi:hypothetical protein
MFRTKGKVYVVAGMSEDEDIFVHYLLSVPTNAHISFPFSFLSLGAVGFICIRRLFWCLSIIMLHFWTAFLNMFLKGSCGIFIQSYYLIFLYECIGFFVSLCFMSITYNHGSTFSCSSYR